MSQYNVHIVEPTSIDAAGFKARRGGLEVRDCLLILEPSGSKRLGILVREPMETTVVESVTRGGGGVIEIDMCRVMTGGPSSGGSISGRNALMGKLSGQSKATLVFGIDRTMADGRFPSNLLLKHGPSCICEGTKKVSGASTSYTRNVDASNKFTYGNLPRKKGHFQQGYAGEDGKEEVANWICEPSCPVGILDRQSGNRPSTLARLGHGGPNPSSASYANKSRRAMNRGLDLPGAMVYGDEGGASRFFKQVQTEEELESYLDTLVRKGHEI